MKSILRVAAATAVGMVAFGVGAPVALAGSAHFVDGTFAASRSGNSITVSGKEAGLGNEAQVHIVVSATAACIKPGRHHPKAANKQSVSVAGDFPVQNGRANFSLTLSATFQPDCTPPKTVVYTNVTVTDTTNGISKRFGTRFGRHVH